MTLFDGMRTALAVLLLLGLFAPLEGVAQPAARVLLVGVLGEPPSPLIEAFRQGMDELGYVEGQTVTYEYRWARAASDRLRALAADAQPPAKVARIGFLDSVPSTTHPQLLEAFRQGLRELGYVEGQNIVIEQRWAGGSTDRLRDIAAELAQLKVEVILISAGTQQIRAVQHIIQKIPLVVPTAADPVGTGLAASLARPGGNITGLALHSPALGAKRLELLKEVVPGLVRVAVLYNSFNPVSEPQLKETTAAARSLGIQLQPLGVRGPDEFEGAFSTDLRSSVRRT